MPPLQHTMEALKHKAQSTEGRAERKATKMLVKQQAATAALMAQHQKELGQLQAELADLRRRSSGGGFPWMWLILAGGAYALYRSNPAVREQIQGLVARAKSAGEDVMSTAQQGTGMTPDESRPLAVVEQVAAELKEKSKKGDGKDHHGP